MAMLTDHREQQSTTVAEADAKFASLALLDVKITAACAKVEKRVADLKGKLAEETEEDKAERQKIAKWLDGYVWANRERFRKPRKRKTEFGNYGLERKPKLNVDDEAAVIAYADKHNLPLYKVVQKIDKKAVKAALTEGREVPGVKEVNGDIVKINVDKKLLDAAALEAAGEA